MGTDSIMYWGANIPVHELPSSVTEVREACIKEPENHANMRQAVNMMS